MGLAPKRQSKLKDDIRFKIESARQCQLGRRSRPPQSLPSSWHSLFLGFIFLRQFPAASSAFQPSNSSALNQLSHLLSRVLNNGFFVNRQKLPVPHDHLSINHDASNIGRLGGVNHGGYQISWTRA